MSTWTSLRTRNYYVHTVKSEVAPDLSGADEYPNTTDLTAKDGCVDKTNVIKRSEKQNNGEKRDKHTVQIRTSVTNRTVDTRLPAEEEVSAATSAGSSHEDDNDSVRLLANSTP
jgi:hypothetical protein